MEDDDGPMALGADEAADDDDMSDLQASTAAVQQSDSDDDESDSDDSDDDDDSDSDSDDSDDDEDDDKTKKETEKKETESDAPTKLSGESQIGEDKTKIKADKKKAKKIKKQKKLKKGVADKEAKKVPQQQEASVQLLGGSDAAQDTEDLKADKAKVKKKSKSIEIKPEKPEEEASLKTTQESSKLTDDDSPVLLNSLNVAVDDTTDLKAGTAKVENKTKVTEFKAESNDDESSKSTPSENNSDKQFEDGDDDRPGSLLGADDAAQDDNDMITPGTAASENNNDNQFEDGDDDSPGLLLGADDAAQDDNNMITPGTAASEKNELGDDKKVDDDSSPGLLLAADDAAQDENITPGTAASEKNESGDDTKVDESIKETKQIVLPDMDESERAMYDYVAECREVFAYVDSTEKGTIPLSAMPHALHCLGLCPFTCDIDAMEEEAAESKEIGFAFFMATAMRIRKRERLTKTPGVVVMDTWGQLDKYMGLNGKINLDDLKGILSQMGDGMDTSELASSFQNSRQFVDEYGMLDFSSWLKSVDPSIGA